MNSQFVRVYVVCVSGIRFNCFIPLSFDFFPYYARVPLNGGWRTTGGTRTTVITPLLKHSL
jgi:hypothetical protein